MSLVCGLDCETTGLRRDQGAQVIEVAAVLLDCSRGTVVARYSSLVRPTDLDDTFAARYRGALAANRIEPQDLAGAPGWAVAGRFLSRFASQAEVYVAHNWDFDRQWLDGVVIERPVVDTMLLHEEKFKKWPKLADLARHYEFPPPEHRALSDAECAVRIAWKGGFLRSYR